MGCLPCDGTPPYTWDGGTNYCQKYENTILVEIITEAQMAFAQVQLGMKYCGPVGTDAGRSREWVWSSSTSALQRGCSSSACGKVSLGARIEGCEPENCLMVWCLMVYPTYDLPDGVPHV